MNVIGLLSAALPWRTPPEDPEEGVCCVLGTREPTVPRKHAIKPSFTNLDLLRAPDSDRVSVRAWRVLTYMTEPEPGKKRGRQPLIQSAWIVHDGGIEYLSRLDVRRYVLDGVSFPRWAGYATTSYKKHGSLRAPVNTGRAQRWLFELDVVDCSDRARVGEWWSILLEARTAGIPRPVIETLDIGLPLMRKHLALWQRFEPWARSRCGSSLYRFLTYLLPGAEELKGAGQAVSGDA